MKKEPKAKLILVGEGELRKAIEMQINEYGISDNVLMVGAMEDIAAFYSMADVFLFPSLYEGLGIVLLEAQANGLPIVASDSIPEEVKILESVRFISLNKDESVWCEQILKAFEKGRDENAMEKVAESRFERDSVIDRMKTLLFL